ncbi:MAG: hypothetical protein Q8R82_08480 [Hyphomonadaceae bacterium]|nr:hypothetical protein [Hyphomonadaceae bacterium]
MKAWGLIFSIAAVCVACSTPQSAMPVSSPIEPYVGPPLSAPIEFDRADAGKMKQAPPMATPAPVKS